jgi:hypothetical protein
MENRIKQYFSSGGRVAGDIEARILPGTSPWERDDGSFLVSLWDREKNVEEGRAWIRDTDLSAWISGEAK